MVNAEEFHDPRYVFRLPNMVAHDAGKSSPVRLNSGIGDQLVAVLPREGEIRHAGAANVPKLPTAEPVDGGWQNPKPVLTLAALRCLLVGSGQQSTSRSTIASNSSFTHSSSRDNFAVSLASL